MNSGSANWKRVYRAIARHGPCGNCRPRSPASHCTSGSRALQSWGRLCSSNALCCGGSKPTFFSHGTRFRGCVPNCARSFRKPPSRSSNVPSESAIIVSTCWVTTPWIMVPRSTGTVIASTENALPRKPWFRMEYLDFAEVGDSKVTWELNRHQHLVTLAKAFRLSGEREICRRVIPPVGALACGKSVSHRHQLGQQPGSCFSQYFMALGVFSVWRNLRRCPRHFGRHGCEAWRFPAATLTAIYLHISRRTLTYSERRLRCFSSALSARRLPLPGAGNSADGRFCNRRRSRQVQTDGLHFEQSLYYHVYALDFFLHAAVLASVNQIANPSRI